MSREVTRRIAPFLLILFNLLVPATEEDRAQVLIDAHRHHFSGRWSARGATA